MDSQMRSVYLNGVTFTRESTAWLDGSVPYDLRVGIADGHPIKTKSPGMSSPLTQLDLQSLDFSRTPCDIHVALLYIVCGLEGDWFVQGVRFYKLALPRSRHERNQNLG